MRDKQTTVLTKYVPFDSPYRPQVYSVKLNIQGVIMSGLRKRIVSWGY